jgi:hypothetical protein
VLLHRPETADSLRIETLDISNNGFYFTTTQPFAPGEQLTCLINLPVRLSAKSECKDPLYLRAEVDVIRIVVNNDNGFGVGCRISEYRVLMNEALPSWAVAPPEESVSATAMDIEYNVSGRC